MKHLKLRSLTAAVLAMLLLPMSAYCETIFSGEVTAQETHVIVAPFGGNVEHVYVRAGDSVQIGDAIAELGTRKVYSMTEGKVSGVFAMPGDAVKDVSDRYGALVYIEPINRYKLECTTERAYNSSENRYIHIGETVSLLCTKDGSHQGRGMVVALDEEDETKFTVEVTAGEFYMGETVDVYRREDYDATSRIGRGTVMRTQPVAVTGEEGSVLRMHVKSGENVERGELLYETVSGTLDGLYAPDTNVVSDIKGVVASVDAENGTNVEKDAKIVTLYPEDKLQVRMTISEADLMDVQVGNGASIEFNWDSDSTRRFDGVISSISYLKETPEQGAQTNNAVSGAQYVAYVDFVPDETVRIGMTVVVYVQDEPSSTPESTDEPAVPTPTPGIDETPDEPETDAESML